MTRRLLVLFALAIALVAVACAGPEGDDNAQDGTSDAALDDDDATGDPAMDETGADFGAFDPISETRAGDLTGYVIDPRDNSPVAGAEVGLFFTDGSPADPTILVTGLDGKFEWSQIAQEDYVVEVTHDNYQTTELWTHVADNGQTQISNVWLVPKPLIVLGSVSGTIRDAQTGIPVANADVDFRAGLNAPDTEAIVTSTTTSGAGLFTASMDAGVYTAYVSALGKCDTKFSVYVLGARTTNNQNGALTSALSQGQMRIVLSWGITPSDLDSHLWMPHTGCSTQNPFHLYYGNRSSQPCGAWMDLDLDDVSSYGPETTTVGTVNTPLTFNPHYFLVQDFSNRTSGGSQAMSNSQNLRVEVFTGGSASCEQTTFTMPPNTPATVWHVFTAEYDGTDWSVVPTPDVDAYCFISDPTAVGPTCP